MKLIKLIPLMGLLLPLSLSATDYQWLTFKMTDDSEMSVAADDLSINYSSGTLHLNSATVDESIDVEDIKTMKFASLPAGINDVSTAQPEEADYYTVAGIKVGRFDTVDDARSELPSGIYIGKSETKTFKVIF